MTWEILVSLIVAVTGLISAVWAILKYYDIKREKKQTQSDNFMKEMRDENKEQSTKIDSLITRTTRVETELGNLKDDLASVHEQLNAQEYDIQDNEMNRLQTAIMDFASALRAGHPETLNSFNYIFHAYDKYKSLGGNSFVDSEMEYIRKKKLEFNFIEQKDEEIKK